MSADLARDIAHEVVEILREQGLVIAAPSPTLELLTAAEIAERFRLTREWIYNHQDELSAIRLGDGKRPRLRFDPQRVMEALAVPAAATAPPPPRTTGRLPRARASRDTTLLEIRGDDE